MISPPPMCICLLPPSARPIHPAANEVTVRSLLLMMLIGMSSIAEADVLVDRLPKGIESPMVIDVIQRAFIGRGWTVTEASAVSVSARIEKPPVLTAFMTVSIYGQALVYEGTAKRRSASGPQGGVLMYEQPLPDRWVKNIRNDISLVLATVPDR